MLSILWTCFCGGRRGRRSARPAGNASEHAPRRSTVVLLVLTRDAAPRAFGRGEPFKAIAALVLFASLLSLMIFSLGWREQLKVGGGFTDNAGNEVKQTDDIEISTGGSY